MNFKFYINAIFLSLYSRQFYAQIFNNEKLSPIKYILILSVLTSIPISMEIKKHMNNFVVDGNNSEQIKFLASQFPEISISGNKFLFSTKENINITNKAGDVVAIIDAENKIQDALKYERVIIISSGFLTIKLPDKSSYISIPAESLKDNFKNYITTKNGKTIFDINKLLTETGQVVRTPVLFVVIFASLWYLLTYAITILAYSLVVGAFINLMLKTRGFNFKLNLRIAAFTSTLVILFEMLANTLPSGLFSAPGVVYFITHLIYIHFAVESYKKQFIR